MRPWRETAAGALAQLVLGVAQACSPALLAWPASTASASAASVASVASVASAASAASAASVASAASAASAQSAPQAGLDSRDARAVSVPSAPVEWLVIEPIDAGGRAPFRPDAVFARHLLDRGAAPPEAGESLTGELGEGTWAPRAVGALGRISGPVGWAYAAFEAEAETVVLLRADGARQLFVNGEGHMGDLYRRGYGPVPVALRAGRNDVYVACRRGSGFGLVIEPADETLLAFTSDVTRPDLVAGAAPPETRDPLAPPPMEAAVLVLNASRRATGPLTVTTGGGRLPPASRTEPGQPALSVTKLPLPLGWDAPAVDPAWIAGGETRLAVPVCIEGQGGAGPLRFELHLDVRRPHEARRATFVSEIDGSVQQYALLEAEGDGLPGLVLTLHGAGVDCLAQVRSYGPKADLCLVAPTNRREFGFDWQDWGRADAYEVLAAARERLSTDPARRYLTGHSMGGHGTWHLAANDPDGFAAIAPSAGWIGFDSYGGRPAGALAELWAGADRPSRTLELLDNLVPIPTYILHGEADDNVPVSEARGMQAALRDAGAPPVVHWEEGAGHWWDGPRGAGADCVDWPPIFELFGQARRTAGDEIAFLSADPGVDAEHEWIALQQPLRYGQPLRLRARLDRDTKTVHVETDNVRSFAPASWSWAHEHTHEWLIDGDRVDIAEVAAPAYSRTGPRFVRDGPHATWKLARVADTEKRPDRCGPFKRAFGNRFVLVYPTAGTDAENREGLARARHDAEAWWYRANGRAVLLSDRECLASARTAEGERNVILYGNADTNGAWRPLLGEAGPLEVRRGAVTVGDRTWEGDDLGALFVVPRADGMDGLVGAIASTGVRGDRAGYAVPYFVSGVGLPDYTVFTSRVVTEGDGGVLAAGWLDHRWQLDGSGYRADP